jgi:tetratricopeptide (TPR) repeat protein
VLSLILRSSGKLFWLATPFLASCGLSIDDDARLARAQSAFEAGQYAAAIVDLKSVLQNRPDSGLAWKYLGLATAESGDFVAAESGLEKAMALGEPMAAFRVVLTEAKLASGKAQEALELADPGLAADRAEAFRIWLQRGDALEQLGRVAEALQSFESAAQLSAERSTAWLRSAQAHRANGNAAAARAFVDLALAEDPDDPDANLAHAALLLDSKELEAAEQTLRRALERLPLDLDQRANCLAYLAETQLAKDDPVAAEATIAELMTIWPPDDPDLQLLGARRAFALGDFAAASDLLQKYLAEFVDPGWPTVLLGAALLERGLLNQAQAYLAAAIAAEPLDIEARKLSARADLIDGNFAAARSTLAPALAAAPGDRELLGLTGVANLERERDGDSFEFYWALINDRPVTAPAARAGAVAPDDSHALSIRGLAWLARGRSSDALDALSRALAADPGNVDYRLNLALAYLGDIAPAQGALVLEQAADREAMGQHELYMPISRALLVQAHQLASTQTGADLKGLLQWLDVVPGDQQIRELLADSYLDLEDFAAAATHYERALAVDPGDAVLLNNLAWCYASLGDSRALELARRAFELDPNNGAIADTVGWILISMDQPEAGLKLLEQADLLAPTNALIQLHLAEALAQIGAAVQ